MAKNRDKEELLIKEWLSLGGEKAERGTLKKLSDKYKVPESTVRRWKKDYLKKNKMNVQKKTNERTKRTNERDIKIQQDILNGDTKEEIIQRYSISERTYYKKSENARKLRLEKTEEYLDKIVEEVYPDLQSFLKNLAVSKRNVAIRTIETVNRKENNVKDEEKKIQFLEKKFNLITKMEREIMKTGKLLNGYELLEIDKQLKDEELQQQKLEIEKNKNSIVDEKESVVIVDDTDKD